MAGVSVKEFWNMSPQEIFDTVKAYYTRVERRKKAEIWNTFLLAEVLTGYICLKEGQEKPHPWDYYPKLFSEEKAVYEEEMKAERFEEYKERKREYIAEMNRRRREM